MAGKLPDALAPAIDALKAKLVAEPQTIATRKASEVALETITAVVPELILGSADLTPSNNTKTKNLSVLKAGEYGGRYIHYGIREHGMAAAMNGMALHGGVIPAGATFMVFTDYCRPAIRLSALMGVRVIYVMTHDSIGLGEDGPTHQPVEHLAALRAIPNLDVFRPADPVETAECWQLALENGNKPTVLALTRQNLAPFRKTDSKANLCAKGAYELSPAQGKAQVSLFASGSEVEIAMAAQAQLVEKGIAARVVSVPSLTRLLALSDAERAAIIGDAAVNIAIEAGIRMGWDQVIGPKGAFIGMNSFGASAPYKELYAQFGITAEHAVKEAMARL
jgi:transketolase